MSSILCLAVLLAGTQLLKCSNHDLAIADAKDAVLAIKVNQERAALPVPGSVNIPAKQPNIVVIVADDLGWRDVGYQFSEIETPVIDQLAMAGVRLNRFYVQPSCSPTRAALITGKSPMRLGIYGPLSKNNPTGLPLTEETLADRLKALGYQTALTGKWHLGPRNLAYHPNARGFDHFYGHLTGGVGYYDKVHGGGYDWQRNGKTAREEGYATALVANEAIQIIKQRHQDKPLFLYAAFGAPHLPNEAPEETLAKYEFIGDENRRIHAAMVEELDIAIGRIYLALVEAGIEQNTLIWFMSDNGGLFPTNPLRFLPDSLLRWAIEFRLGFSPTDRFVDFMRTNSRDGGSDNRPFAGGKQSVAEGGVRVPGFIHWPDGLRAHKYNHMLTVQDVMPTLVRIAGGEVLPSDYDGRDLWTSLKTQTPPVSKDYVVHTSQLTVSEAIYRYPYKLIEQDGEQRLYDLEIDPLEQRDIAAEVPLVVNELSAALAAFPRGKNIAMPLEPIVADPDYFGGVEDRLPWAEQAYSLSTPSRQGQ